MTTGFRRADLQEAFFVPGTHPFRVWGYGTTDPLGEVPSSDYFRAAGGLMHPGDLIYISVRPVRLVQDYRRPVETWATTAMTRRCGWTRRGRRVVAAVLHGTGRPPHSSPRCAATMA